MTSESEFSQALREIYALRTENAHMRRRDGEYFSVRDELFRVQALSRRQSWLLAEARWEAEQRRTALFAAPCLSPFPGKTLEPFPWESSQSIDGYVGT